LELILYRRLHGNYRSASVRNQIIPRCWDGFLASVQLTDFERVAEAAVFAFVKGRALGERDTLVGGNPGAVTDFFATDEHR
jgi:hypothetical protein